MHRCTRAAVLGLSSLLLLTTFARADTVGIGQLNLESIHQDWGTPQVDKSVDGHPLTIAGKTFDHGLGTHAQSVWWIDVANRGERFTASVGLDDEVKSDPKSSRVGVEFKVIGDRKTLYRSGRMKVGDAAKAIDVDLHGVKMLILVASPVNGNNNYAHCDWADGTITYTGARPTPIEPPADEPVILTPPPPATPRI